MLNSPDTEISQDERQAAIHLLNAIARSVGDAQAKEVEAIDMHRLITFLAGAVLETDQGLQTSSEFQAAGHYLGELIAHHAMQARQERKAGGATVIDLALIMADQNLLETFNLQ